MSTTTVTPAAATAVTPYLTVSDGVGALEFYGRAFGAVEQFRVVGDDGRLGHAEFTIGTARFMLSDEYPEMEVKAPTTLGGAATMLYLEVPDVDAMHARAVAEGASELRAPADQTHGNRTSTISDPYGHRWMLSQALEAFDLDTYAEREGGGFTVQKAPGADEGSTRGAMGRIWPGVNFADADAGIAFLTDVLGFEEQLVVRDGDVVVHSQLTWPEGGGLMTHSAARTHHDFLADKPTGAQNIYVVTADPQAVHDRCVTAGAEIVQPPHQPDHDPDGLGFSVRDPEGNIWSFGTYAGEG